jgi:hypothetical protein
MKRALVVLLALSGVARADEDARPTDLTIPLPDADFTPATLPKDVSTELPKDGWWKKKKPCPKGAKLKKGTLKISGDPWKFFRCEGKSTQPKPFTAWRTDKAGEREEGWEDRDGERHGMMRSRVNSVYEWRGVWVHGKEEGRHEETPVGSGDIRFTTWKNGVRHGLERRGNSGKPLLGYRVDGKKVGVWLVTHGPLDDTVRARLVFVDGKRHGTQRWWYQDGALLAKGEYAEGVGSWTIFAEDGSVHSKVDCRKTPDDVLCAYDDVPPLQKF